MFKKLRDHRYDGYMYGGGISIGHQWILSKRWGIEGEIGAGYARMHYDEYAKGKGHAQTPYRQPQLLGCNQSLHPHFIYFIH